MKILVLIFILFSGGLCAQETFKKSYRIKNPIYFPSGNTYLKKSKKISYKDLKILINEVDDISLKKEYEMKIEEFEKLFPLDSKISESIETSVKGSKSIVIRTYTIEEQDRNKIKIQIPIIVNKVDFKRVMLKFKDDKIFVNPYVTPIEKKNVDTIISGKNYLEKSERKQYFESQTDIKSMSKDETDFDRNVYYFDLKNRQSAKFNFREFFISALTLPIKYRFGSDNQDIQNDIAAGINVNLFSGIALGSTRFLYRKDVDNLERTHKLLVGGIIGTSVVEVNSENSAPELEEGKDFNDGVLSLGLGIGYSTGKFQIVAFYGWDNTFGDPEDGSSRWVYDERPWLGLGVGLNLLK